MASGQSGGMWRDIFCHSANRLQFIVPQQRVSNLYRCLKRHGLNRLPPEEGEGPPVKKRRFKPYAIGYVHIDITELRLGKQKRYLFVGPCHGRVPITSRHWP